jgi:hypothetical protein
MAKIWKGPCEALRRAHADPLWAAIHRRAGRLFVACNIADNGRSGTFYRVEKIKGEWYQFDLGRAEGSDPFSTALAGYRRFTPLDAELVAQNHQYLDRLAEDIVLDGRAIVRTLNQAADYFLP